MYIVNSDSSHSVTPNKKVELFIDGIDESYLKRLVERIAIPRHFMAESSNNTKVADYIVSEFERYGLTVFRQGPYHNLMASNSGNLDKVKIIIGAHYDSVPKSPGADDNASAVAGMLAVARALSRTGTPSIAFIAFNREEDGLLGSKDFVQNLPKEKASRIEQVHILEMIGYCSHQPGSQSLPPGLPVKISDIGNFLAILSNRDSNEYISSILQAAATYVPTLPVKVLKLFLGIEKYIPHLLRSDHSPFWDERIPAFMWTDTSEFRNPHYHQPSDTADTLDYTFLLQVTQLLTAHVVNVIGE